MSQNVKTNHEIIMTPQEIIDKILTINSLKLKDQNDLAMKSGILPNTLTIAIKRETLSDDIVTKIHDRLGVRKAFLRTGIEPVLEESAPSMVNESDPEVYRTIVEGKTEYLLIPRSVMQEKYRLRSMEDIEKDRVVLDALIEFNRLLLSKVPISQELLPKPSKVQKG